jgi:hypothetical protein
MLDMANDSGLFRTESDLASTESRFNGWSWSDSSTNWLPLYEAKMLSHFNHRHGDYALAIPSPGKEVRALPTPPVNCLDDPNYEVVGRYWVPDDSVREATETKWDRAWLFGWRNIATSLDVRTMIPSVLPYTGIGHAFPLALPADPTLTPLLQATWSSLVFDYITRQKHGGANLTYGVLYQLACPKPDFFDTKPSWASCTLREWITARVLELTYSTWRLAPYAVDVLGLPRNADPGPPFRWSPSRREILRAELDAAYLHIYGLTRDEGSHVLDSFTILRRYEERDHGEYRTKRLVLEIYDALAEAEATGTAYQTVLDPPPGEGPRHPAHSAAVAGVS